MLLADLYELHKELVDQRLMLPDGFKRTRVNVVVDLKRSGEVNFAAAPVGESGRPAERIIPDLPRTSGIDPLLIADKLSYVAGFAAPGKKKRARAQWEAYRSLLRELINEAPSDRMAARVGAVLEATSDPTRLINEITKEVPALDPRGVGPEADDPGRPDAAEVKALTEQAQWLVDFTVEGEGFFPSVGHDHEGDPDVVAWWIARVAQQSTSTRVGMCQVTNARAPLARLFPAVGELPGNSPRLVSCNWDAAKRYGSTQSDGAAVSVPVAGRATLALKWLTGEGRREHRWDLGDLVLVWWCPDDLGSDQLSVLREPDPAVVRDVLSRSVWAGRPGVDQDSEFHLAVLTVNSARIVVRADHATTLGALQARLDDWFAGLAPVRSRAPHARLGIGELAAGACGPGRSQAPQRARVATDLVRRAVLGGRLPVGLRDRVVRRCGIGTVDRQGKRIHVTAAQAALLHVIAHSWERNEPLTASQGEWCGRLLAVLEETQRRALGAELNRGVQASYGAAAATPRLVFPRLLSRRVAHAKVLSGDLSRRGSLRYLERQMEDVIAGLKSAGGFPAQLRPDGQAEFALGYWHQRHDMRSPAPEAAPVTAGSGTPSDDDMDDDTTEANDD